MIPISFKRYGESTQINRFVCKIFRVIFRVRDVKIHLLQTLNELFCGELGFIQIIHETNPEKGITRPINDIEPDNMNYCTSANYEHPKLVGGTTQVCEYLLRQFKQRVKFFQVLEIQNGDLCEADQTRVLNADVEEEEEGAVGGILESSQSVVSNNTNHQVNNFFFIYLSM